MAKNLTVGKSAEHKIFSMLLKAKYDVYAPLCDDKGIDCVVRKSNGKFVLLQIKARSADVKLPLGFADIKHEETKDYYFIFYTQKTEEIWIIPSKDFVNIATPNKSKKNKGKWNISFSNKKTRAACEKFKVKDPNGFSKFF